MNRTESFIAAARYPRHSKPLLLNADYLDDESLPDEERTQVLAEIFSRDVRSKELQALAHHFAPLLDGRPASHTLICGPTGSGKTATILHFLASLKTLAEREQVELDWRFVELSAQSTCFAALNRIAVSLEASRTYFKWIPNELMQTKIRENLKARSGTVIFFLDEIDNVVTDRDIFMTYLVKSLPRQVPVRLLYIFTTNRLDWDKNLDARVLSCMRKHDLIFHSYNAMEITEILKIRVEKALETEKTLSLAQTLPLHQQIGLAACYGLLLQKQKRIHTGDAYDAYKQICTALNRQPLSQRRFSDIIGSLDLYSWIVLTI